MIYIIHNLIKSVNHLSLPTSRDTKLLHHLVAKSYCWCILEIITDNIVPNKIQRTLGYQLRIKLTNRSCGQITWIFEKWLARLLTLVVKFSKIILKHYDFTTNLRPTTQEMSKLLIFPQTQRHVLNRPDIHSYVLTNSTIATRHRLNEYAIFINQRTCQTVHLDITQKFI